MNEKDKRELEELVRQMPDWQKHLADFRKRHPEMNPREVMKKAGFTYRMKKGKLLNNYINKLFQRVLEEHGVA